MFIVCLEAIAFVKLLYFTPYSRNTGSTILCASEALYWYEKLTDGVVGP